MHPSRKRLRLAGFDYRQAGAYFITICTWRWERVLGTVTDGQVHLSVMGAIVEAAWRSIPLHHPGVAIDAFVVMPHHVHGILVFRSSVQSLGEVVGKFKAASTRGINQLRRTPGARVWHRSYYDHIIRDDRDWWRVRRYIDDNPRNWDE